MEVFSLVDNFLQISQIVQIPSPLPSGAALVSAHASDCPPDFLRESFDCFAAAAVEGTHIWPRQDVVDSIHFEVPKFVVKVYPTVLFLKFIAFKAVDMMK